MKELRGSLLDFECERLLRQTNETGGTVAAVLDSWTTADIRQLAHLLVERNGVVALLAAREPNKLGLAFARSTDRGEDMNRLMQAVCKETGCRSGGNPAFATGGGGDPTESDRVIELAVRHLAAGTT